MISVSLTFISVLSYHLRTSPCKLSVLLRLKLNLSQYTPRRRLGERKWVVSVTSQPRFSPRERIPVTHYTDGWVVSRVSLDTEAGGKILSPLPEIEPRSPSRPARSQKLYWLSYPVHSIKVTWPKLLYTYEGLSNFPSHVLYFPHILQSLIWSP
jgi:hypothetical protein